MQGNTPSPRKPGTLFFTPGEPAGIGPDLCVMLASVQRRHRIVAVADPVLLQQRAEQLGRLLHVQAFQAAGPGIFRPGVLEVLPVALSGEVHCGKPNPAHARYVLGCIDKAVAHWRKGEAVALVTGPVHKGSINASGKAFSGHTEYLACLTGGQPVMMLATPGLRVALATTHLPLGEVSKAIQPERLMSVLNILWRELKQRFQLPEPRIMVCGLNPHAGEDGYLGREEIEIIEPVLQELRAQGMRLTGPVAADTAFTPGNMAQADVVLAMYHDQGLPVLKHLGFGKAANITLGLPIIRTSVDHGTALALAGSGRIDTGSLDYAIEVAVKMASSG